LTALPLQCLLVAAKDDQEALDRLVLVNTRLVALCTNYDSIEKDEVRGEEGSMLMKSAGVLLDVQQWVVLQSTLTVHTQLSQEWSNHTRHVPVSCRCMHACLTCWSATTTTTTWTAGQAGSCCRGVQGPSLIGEAREGWAREGWAGAIH
jgi:hypothetical protein